MNAVDLVQSLNYKSIFNAVYKKHLQDYSTNSIVEVDLQLQKAVDSLCSLRCDKKVSTAFLYILENENGEIEICKQDEEGSESVYSLDVCEWENIACMEFKNSCDRPNAEIAAELLWQMTQWGNNEDIKKIISDIDKTIKYLTQKDS